MTEKTLQRAKFIASGKDAWVEVEFAVGWIAAYRLALQRGAVIVSELRIFPGTIDELRADVPRKPGHWLGSSEGIAASAPVGGVSARLTRKVPGRLAQEVVADFRSSIAEHSGFQKQRLLLDALGFPPSPAVDSRSKRGRKPRPDADYAAIAAQYVELLNTHNPVQRLALNLAISVANVRTMVHQARKRHLLTHNRAGVQGGQLTAKGLKALEEKRKKTRRLGVGLSDSSQKRQQKGRNTRG